MLMRLRYTGLGRDEPRPGRPARRGSLKYLVMSGPNSGAQAGAPVRTGVVPLAGLGTRMLPMTKAVAKGMLPVLDMPVVQYIAREAAEAGLSKLVLVTGDEQAAFETYFSPAPCLERVLAERGDQDSLALIEPASDQPEIAFVRQDVPRGLGDAVLRCAGSAGAEPFAVLLGDNIMRPGDDLLARLIAARQALGGSVVALTPAATEGTAARTVAEFEPTGDPAVVRVTGLVQRPRGVPAASEWIMIGRCVCDPAIFTVLRDMTSEEQDQAADTAPEVRQELQLSDALSILAAMDPAAGGGVHGLLFGGRRFDTGNKQDYLRTTVELACERPDLAGSFVPWLRGFLTRLG
jgi:UTP--glucose-1-phosphate uridylyltransferase